MHQQTPGRTLTQHRKTAVSFRDTCLLDVFSLSLEALRTLKTSKDSKVQGEVRPSACHPLRQLCPHMVSEL